MASGRVDMAWPLPAQPSAEAVLFLLGRPHPACRPSLSLGKGNTRAAGGGLADHGPLEGRPRGKGCDGPNGPLRMGCIWGCSPPAPPLLQRKPQAPKSRIPSSAPPQGEKPGGAFCSCAKGPAKNEDRKLQRKIWQQQKKGNRTFQKGSHIPSQTRQL